MIHNNNFEGAIVCGVPAKIAGFIWYRMKKDSAAAASARSVLQPVAPAWARGKRRWMPIRLSLCCFNGSDMTKSMS